MWHDVNEIITYLMHIKENFLETREYSTTRFFENLKRANGFLRIAYANFST